MLHGIAGSNIQVNFMGFLSGLVIINNNRGPLAAVNRKHMEMRAMD